MKINKEVRIGLLVTVALVVLFAGFYFLKGSNVFSSEYKYYAFYRDVQGLQPSAAVQIHGLQVGKVSEIHLSNDSVIVTIAINKKTRIPQGTVAKLVSLDLLGTKGVSLDVSTSSNMVEDGTMLHSETEGGIIDKLSSEVTPLLTDVRTVVSHVDSVLIAVNGIFSEQARADLQASISALHTSMNNLQGITAKVNGQSEALAHVITNADKITTNLANNSGNIDATLKNLKATTDKLSKAPLDEMIRNLDEASAKLNDMLRKINNNEGSLGLLVNDKNLYNNLNKTLEEFTKLSADLKAHPSRYINLTIFGKKAKVGD